MMMNPRDDPPTNNHVYRRRSQEKLMREKGLSHKAYFLASRSDEGIVAINR